ncbi:hypothetical protein B0H14DRAFT_172763, partial [Mycena olivaceomarginata]
TVRRSPLWLSSCLGHYLPLPRTAFLCVLILAATQLLISSDLPSVARLLRFPDPGSSFLNGYISPAAGAAHRDIAGKNRNTVNNAALQFNWAPELCYTSPRGPIPYLLVVHNRPEFGNGEVVSWR